MKKMYVFSRFPASPREPYGTWPTQGIAPATPSTGFGFSAPDTLTRHDGRWGFH